MPDQQNKGGAYMFFITGDTHADFRRFDPLFFTEQKTLTKDDYVIVCGDFGVWDDSARERRQFDQLNNKPFTTLFVTGNHSNYDLLGAFPVSEWNGGKVQFIRDSVVHLTRGQVFDIADKRFFTMGGASCHYVDDGILEPDAPDFEVKFRQLQNRGALFRVNHFSWWNEELPNDAEYETARKNLDACGWNVDYVITHCAPTSIAEIVGDGTHPQDRLTDFFEEVKDRCRFDHWFFGHYHDNRVVSDRFVLLYDQIIRTDAVGRLKSRRLLFPVNM
jgi:hypothetical protein